MMLKKEGNDRSLSKTVILATFLILSAGFCLGCWKNMSWELLVAYPGGVMLIFIPRTFIRSIQELKGLIQAWKGGSE